MIELSSIVLNSRINHHFKAILIHISIELKTFDWLWKQWIFQLIFWTVWRKRWIHSSVSRFNHCNIECEFATFGLFIIYFEIIWKKHLFEQYWLCESYSEYWYSSKHSMFDMLIHFENEAKWCATFEFETQFVELSLQKTKNAYISNDKVNAWCIVLMTQILKNEKQKNFEQRTNTKNDMMTMMWNTNQYAIVFETTKTKWKQSSIDIDEMMKCEMKNNFIH